MIDMFAFTAEFFAAGSVRTNRTKLQNEYVHSSDEDIELCSRDKIE